MSNRADHFSKKNALIIACTISLIISILIFYILVLSLEKEAKEDEATINEHIGEFRNKVLSLMNSNINLLEGYQAYLLTKSDYNELDTELFLENLTKKNFRYIRNIAIIEDTTIIHNYPIKGNEASIGVDLATIEGQNEIILKVKYEDVGVFQGPVSLIQGGSGFIIRLPLKNIENLYWGQVSIVLNTEEIYKSLDKFSKDTGLAVLIYDQYDGKSRVYGDEFILEQNPIHYTFDLSPINWSMYIIPENGWKSYNLNLVIVTVMSLLLSIIIILVIYLFQKYYYIKYQSYHDGLTGLLNRNFLKIYASILCDESSRQQNYLGVMVIDVNKFKYVNDNYGHHIGDLVLKEIARIFQKYSRKCEKVIRIGGDEFLISIPSIESKEELLLMRTRLLKVYEDEFHIEGLDLNVSVSIGAAFGQCICGDLSNLILEADQDMYKMKRDENT